MESSVEVEHALVESKSRDKRRHLAEKFLATPALKRETNQLLLVDVTAIARKLSTTTTTTRTRPKIEMKPEPEPEPEGSSDDYDTDLDDASKTIHTYGHG